GKVPVKTVGFLDQDHTAARVRFEILQHGGETRTAGLLGRVYITKLLLNGQIIFCSIRREQCPLRRNAKA
ncbi:MAG TPA: hypothetical protein VF753_06855, partial [Terriglobales bacterium]